MFLYSKILYEVYSKCLFLVTNDQVEVVALSSYEEKEEQFKEQVLSFLLIYLLIV